MNKNIPIFAYKHDGSIHRVWQESIIIDETDEFIVMYNDNTKVIEYDGKSWTSTEPALVFFYKNNWFNVLCILKNEYYYYYCNMASPFVRDHDVIKYIDYDLDLKVFKNNDKLILDKDEFEYNSRIYNYSDKLVKVINNELDFLKSHADLKEGAFDPNRIQKYLEKIEVYYEIR